MIRENVEGKMNILAHWVAEESVRKRGESSMRGCGNCPVGAVGHKSHPSGIFISPKGPLMMDYHQKSRVGVKRGWMSRRVFLILDGRVLS